ncbi:hypothetical protein QWZ16_23230 [Vibrio ostreicida]|uniref:Uncharacterized protein n=1 Tax=Vibrio ostreicida TaxID=526588 RepID=A0ABT8C2S7_9VIBR|nr:hypothetical protein [Vibrio ostreicida]MDN3612515.1 hypothetical protein [Vibrio ostreicida]
MDNRRAVPSQRDHYSVNLRARCMVSVANREDATWTLERWRKMTGNNIKT